ncbi:MAG: MFS transporter [Haloarculaceae archaeon]
MRIWSDPFRRRWLVFAVLATTYATVSIYRLSTAVLADQLLTAFDISATGLGTLHAAFFYIYAVMQLPAGVLADRWGSRGTVVAGTAVMSVGGLAFGLADSYLAAFAGRTLVGLGGSVLFVAILRFCANWFQPSEFARMSGLTMAVAGFGGILATTPLAVVVGTAGWRPTMIGLGAFGVLLALLALALVRDSPAAAGLDAIEGVPAPGTPSLRQIGRNALVVLQERETWLVGVMMFFGTGVNITVFGLWGVPYVVQTYGVSVARASVYTLVGSAGLLVGPPALGALSDRLGARTPVMVAGQVVFVASFATLALVGAPPLPVVGLVFFLAGSLAGTFALGYTVVKERHAGEASGVSTGTVNTMAFVGAAVFPTVMGAILDVYATGQVNGTTAYSVVGYQYAFGIASVAGLLALGCTTWLHLRTRHERQVPGAAAGD